MKDASRYGEIDKSILPKAVDFRRDVLKQVNQSRMQSMRCTRQRWKRVCKANSIPDLRNSQFIASFEEECSACCSRVE